MQDNQAQADYWSSESGLKWIEFEDELNLIFGAVDRKLIDLSDPVPSERVLDIGCGTGATSREFSKHIGSNGTICAVDISSPLIAHARGLSSKSPSEIQYHLADAQSDKIPGGPFDLVFSRFGSMFFADPVEAFNNIRQRMKQDGRIVLAAWAKAKGNPWFEVPQKGAEERLGPLDQSDPNAPGPLGFQNTNHVVSILEQAGFESITSETIRVDLVHPGPVERVAALASNIGPAARVIKKYKGAAIDIEEITRYVTASYRRFVDVAGVRIPANLNFFKARSPHKPRPENE